MRTTLTLDEDVAQRLDRMRRERPESFKQLVNDAIRMGLDQMETPQARKPFRTKTVDHGKPFINLDNISAALEYAEGPHHR